MTRFLKVAAIAAVLGACAAPAPRGAGAGGLMLPPDYSTAPSGEPTAGECDSNGLDRFRGRQATGEVGAEMLRVSGARTIRWARPGMAMTMEFNPRRLTVHIDSANLITRAACG